MSRRIDEIIIHCAATPRTWYADKSLDAQVAEIRRWHVVENKWVTTQLRYQAGFDGVY